MLKFGRHPHVVMAERASLKEGWLSTGEENTDNSLRWDTLEEKINSTWRGRKMEALRKVWEAWKRFGQFIGDQLGRVVLTIFYFTLFMPFALGVRFFSDPLALRPVSNPKWLERTTHDLTLDDSRRLF